MFHKYASKLLISLAFICSIPQVSHAALTCAWPAGDDSFVERATGYLVTASDWNTIQCILQKMEQELGNNLENVFKLSANNTATGDNTFSGLASFLSTVDVADKQDTIGNKIKLRANNGTFSSTCTNIGEAGYLTFADTSNMNGLDYWSFCTEGSIYFHIPNTGTSVPLDNYVLVGDTSAGLEAAWKALPTNCTVGLIFDGTNFYCGVASGVGTGDVVGPASANLDSIAVYNSGTGKLLRSTQVYINNQNQLILNDADSASATAGNKIQLFDNDAFDHACGTAGVAGVFTIMDLGQGTDDLGICSGTANYFLFPNTGSSSITDNDILMGTTTAGTATYLDWQVCNPTTQKIHFDGTSLSCVADSGGSGSVSGPVTSTLNAVPRYSDTSGDIIKDSGVTITDQNQLVMPDNSNTTGNLFKLLENNGSAPTTCSDLTNAADSLTLADTTNTTADTFDFCYNGAPLFRIPNTGVSYAADNKFLIGTGANAASWSNAVSCNASSESLTFNGTTLDCQPDARTIVFTYNNFDYDYSTTAYYAPMNTTFTADPDISTATNTGTPTPGDIACTDLKIFTASVGANATITVKLMKNGVTQMLTCSVSTGTPTATCTGTSTAVSTDFLNWQIQCAGAGCNLTDTDISATAKCRFNS